MWLLAVVGGNVVDEAFKAAEHASTLTDRALWLLFLILILAGAWYTGRQKEKELVRLRTIVESAIPILQKSTESLKNLDDTLRDIRSIIRIREQGHSSESGRHSD